MKSQDFTELSNLQKLKFLSTAVHIATNNEVLAMLFLVDDFFVEVSFESLEGNMNIVTFTSSTTIPKAYLDLVKVNF